MECNRRLAGARGPRAFEAMAALIYRSPQVNSGVVYLGDSCIDSGREHCCGRCRKEGRARCEHEFCCMARLMHRCGKTAHRAKYDLAEAGLIRLHHAGRKLCPCARCGGDSTRKAGGSILDGDGRAVGAATGYELDPQVFAAPVERPARPTGAAATTLLRPPATIAQGLEKIRAALERRQDRAGP